LDLDGVIPVITSVATSDTGNKKIGQTVTVVVTFSEDVNLSGAGTLDVLLNVGTALYSSKTANTVTCVYTVADGDEVG
jgi:hypothetical protein